MRYVRCVRMCRRRRKLSRSRSGEAGRRCAKSCAKKEVDRIEDERRGSLLACGLGLSSYALGGYCLILEKRWVLNTGSLTTITNYTQRRNRRPSIAYPNHRHSFGPSSKLDASTVPMMSGDTRARSNLAPYHMNEPVPPARPYAGPSRASHVVPTPRPLPLRACTLNAKSEHDSSRTQPF